MLFGMTWEQICWCFLVYSFLGWIVEVIYHAVTMGEVINRGFLNGPVCPIYGFGVLSVFAMINFIGSREAELNELWIFIFGFILATLVELLGGWLLDKFFHARWWDYSDNPLNFHGYICLEFSIIWGLAILLVVQVVQKYVEKFCSVMIESKFGLVVAAVFLTLYMADFIVTVAVVRGFDKRLGRLNEIRKEMRVVSDALSETVGERSIAVAQKIGEEKVQISLAKAEFRDSAAEKRQEKEEELRRRQRELHRRFDELMRVMTERKLLCMRHILRAFPGMKHHSYDELVTMIKEKYQIKRKP